MQEKGGVRCSKCGLCEVGEYPLRLPIQIGPFTIPIRIGTGVNYTRSCSAKESIPSGTEGYCPVPNEFTPK